jgi:hypothetical protein
MMGVIFVDRHMDSAVASWAQYCLAGLWCFPIPLVEVDVDRRATLYKGGRTRVVRVSMDMISHLHVSNERMSATLNTIA